MRMQAALRKAETRRLRRQSREDQPPPPPFRLVAIDGDLLAAPEAPQAQGA